MRLIVPIALCLVFLPAGTAEAQLCAGAPSFRDNRFQAGVTAALRDGAQGVGGSPFGLFAVHTRLTAEVGGTETTDSDPSGLASVGVGRIFNCNVAIIPEVLVPFSAGNGDAIFSIQFLFNFGQ